MPPTLKRYVDAIQSVNGPVYVRMLRGEIPRLFDRSEPLRLGQARVLSVRDRCGAAGVRHLY